MGVALSLALRPVSRVPVTITSSSGSEGTSVAAASAATEFRSATEMHTILIGDTAAQGRARSEFIGICRKSPDCISVRTEDVLSSTLASGKGRLALESLHRTKSVDETAMGINVWQRFTRATQSCIIHIRIKW